MTRRIPILTLAALTLAGVLGFCSVASADPPRLPYMQLRGFQVTYVVYNSPAMRAGLEPGDIITSVNGVRVQSGMDLRNSLMNVHVARMGVINVRDGQTVYVMVYPVNGRIGIDGMSVPLPLPVDPNPPFAPWGI